MHRCESSNFLNKKPLVMGIINKGILGPVSGTVGTVIGGTWKSIPYLRSQPASHRTEFTQKQLDQQKKFATVLRFLQPLRALLTFSFREYAVRMSGFNNAMSYTLSNAITGTYPDYEINYSLVLVSRGELPNAVNPTAVATSATLVTFSWVDNSGTGKAAETDVAILVVYCIERKQALFNMGTERSAQSATIDVSQFSGLTVQTYIAFIETNGRTVSNSIYTGQLSIPA
jgi:hypothetical protein